MLGDSAMLGGGGGGGEHGGSGDATPAAGTTTTHDLAAAAMSGGGIGSNSGSDDVEKGRIDELGERSFGGNRWPRQETLTLLRIRSDMDAAFRDASVKGPLWEQVSRKLAELGYHRNAKKCKEKFENVYKYHKRTKDGRGGKSDGKTYRFFDQLEALDHHHQQPPPPLSLPAPPQLLVTTPPMSLPINTATAASTVSVPMPPVSNITNSTISVPNITVSSTTSLPTPPFVTNTTPPPPMNVSYPTTFQPSTNPTTTTTTTPFPNIPTDLLSNSSSSSTSSDETLEGTRKRKRKWKDFFEKLMKEVIEKQEELHSRFLEAIEKREHERMVREEAWRTQELQRINREREILAQERSIASAKDSAVMSFLQKIAEQQNQNIPHAFPNINIPQPVPVPPPPPQVQASPHPPPQQQPQPVAQTVMVVQQQQQQVQQQPQQHQQKQEMQVATNMEIVKADNNNSGEKENTTGASSSRWPKVEVEALIKLRTSLDSKYQENGPKGPLWEEISGGMKKLGYNRNPKRCKEKWENINKYFKKVKESNKRRPEDSKTCPYFHQLDALYREKSKHEINVGGGGGGVKMAESMVAPLMVQPEQQWPPQQQQQLQQQEGNIDHEDNDNMEEDEEEEEGTGSGSGSGGSSNFEVVPSKPASAE